MTTSIDYRNNLLEAQQVSVAGAYKLLMQGKVYEYSPINHWVYEILSASYSGRSESLNQNLLFLKDAHLKNQKALISTAYWLAEKQGKEAICARLALHFPETGSTPFKPKYLDLTKELQTPLVKNLVKANVKENSIVLVKYGSLLLGGGAVLMILAAATAAIGLRLLSGADPLLQPVESVVVRAFFISPVCVSIAAGILGIRNYQTQSTSEINTAYQKIVETSFHKGNLKKAFKIMNELKDEGIKESIFYKIQQIAAEDSSLGLVCEKSSDA